MWVNYQFLRHFDKLKTRLEQWSTKGKQREEQRKCKSQTYTKELNMSNVLEIFTTKYQQQIRYFQNMGR